MQSKKQDNLSAVEKFCCDDCRDDTGNTISGKIQDMPFLDDFCTARVNTCGGSVFCPSGKQDSLDLGLKLEERLHKIYFPGKLSIAVSGCDRQCAETCIKDIGIIGMADGWQIFVGVSSNGREHKTAWQLVSGLSTQKVLAVVYRIVVFYRAQLSGKKSLAEMIKGKGFESFRATVLQQNQRGDS